MCFLGFICQSLMSSSSHYSVSSFFCLVFCHMILQGFITNNERALEELFGDEENNRKAVACLNVMATRIATVFASLRVCSKCFALCDRKFESCD